MKKLLKDIQKIVKSSVFEQQIDDLIKRFLFDEALLELIEEEIFYWVNHPERISFTYNKENLTGSATYRNEVVKFSFELNEKGLPTNLEVV